MQLCFPNYKPIKLKCTATGWIHVNLPNTVSTNDNCYHYSHRFHQYGWCQELPRLGETKLLQSDGVLNSDTEDNFRWCRSIHFHYAELAITTYVWSNYCHQLDYRLSDYSNWNCSFSILAYTSAHLQTDRRLKACLGDSACRRPWCLYYFGKCNFRVISKFPTMVVWLWATHYLLRGWESIWHLLICWCRCLSSQLRDITFR